MVVFTLAAHFEIIKTLPPLFTSYIIVSNELGRDNLVKQQRGFYSNSHHPTRLEVADFLLQFLRFFLDSKD